MTDVTTTAFAVNLRRLRMARGWSMRRLSAESVISAATIGNVERGMCGVGLVAAVALARALGASLDEMAGLTRAAESAPENCGGSRG